MPFANTRLGRLYYEEHGEARGDSSAIVLLPSLLMDSEMWRYQIGPLSELGRVIVLDGPGHGRSDVPPPFSLDEHVEALDSVLTQLQVTRAILIGLSWGGMLAMRYALAHPQKLVGLGLLDTSARLDRRANRLRNRLFIAAARRIYLPRALVGRYVAPLMFGRHTFRQRPELIEELTHVMNRHPRVGMTRASKAVLVDRTDIGKEINAIHSPTLVLCGKDDRSTPPAESKFIASQIPGAKMSWIERAGHMSALEEPEQVTRELVAFVRPLLGAT